ncbi:zinc finger protein 626-like, partial [Hyposmocoma kahamanoa]|uniref:zinc finger protein 626-like n=1 Tax=Hyposmocoma kahamanoa TaxID=1477025 RepID=UPI000E6DA23E
EEKRNQPNYMKLPFKCDMCVLGFTKKENYYYHMEKKHDVNVGPYICPTCSIRFTTEQLLECHRKKHYLYYRCHLCKYETTEIKTAWTHSRSKHVNDTEDCRHCECCDFVATTSEELSEHMKAEHSVLCNECGEKFKGPDTLKSHKRRIHNGVKREFQCDICSRAFKTKSRLESHMANHNSTIAQKLAYCTSCNIQYKNIYVYRNHLRTSANHADQM